MKNIHVLPTDKPSRLLKQDNGKYVLSKTNVFSHISKHLSNINQNIYITNNEEIRDGDYALYLFGNLVQKVKIGINVSNKEAHKKIILTTDKDLIKDGVQAIDDEFLKWFVKNPSCEEVNVKHQHVDEFGNYIDDSFHSETDSYLYKIIIPKEEPKQDYSGVHFRHCYQGEYENGCKYGEDNCPAKPKEEPKQDKLKELYLKNNPEKAVVIEQRVSDFMNQLKTNQKTILEAAVKKYGTNPYDHSEKDGFIEGANWQKKKCLLKSLYLAF
jgi:hypothetical protein